MVQLRKDEVKFLREKGLGKFIVGKTCNGKRYAEESQAVLRALKKYNESVLVEG